MAAIDLLLNWSPTSERMHQVVLAGLFQHTSLMELLGIEGKPVDLQIETQGRLYDLSVQLSDGRRVQVELKLDASLGKEQIERQMVAIKPGQLLMYVFLGTTRFTWSRERLEKTREKIEGAPEASSVILVDLQGMQDAMAKLAGLSNDPDHRDLSVAYGSLLRLIDNSTNQFENKPLKSWGSQDWYGFFGKLVADIPLLHAGVDYVANPRKGFVGCWWDFHKLCLSPDAEAYLQLEEGLFCFKVYVESEHDQAKVRATFSNAVLTSARKLCQAVKRPERFGRGKCMTVAGLNP